jgi:hypothetical protein
VVRRPDGVSSALRGFLNRTSPGGGRLVSHDGPPESISAGGATGLVRSDAPGPLGHGLDPPSGRSAAEGSDQPKSALRRSIGPPLERRRTRAVH